MGLLDQAYEAVGGLLGSAPQKIGGLLGELQTELQRRASLPADVRYQQAKDMAMAIGPGLIGSIRAFHGSPHTFDTFDASKIGTGEGAQAYGHGLYFAGKEGVARSYRDALSHQQVMLDAKPASKISASLSDPGSEAAIKRLDFLLRNEPPSMPIESMQDLRAWARSVNPEFADVLDEFGGRVSVTPPGHMYEVNINAEPHQLLDWDKTLAQQSPQVQQALARFGFKHDPQQASAFDDALLAALNDTGPTTLPKQPRNPTGGDIYSNFPIPDRSKLNVSQQLQQAGIPGIQYLDQGSRAAGEGSRNYVVFNPDLITILRRYGLLGPLATGTAATGLLGNGEQQ